MRKYSCDDSTIIAILSLLRKNITCNSLLTNYCILTQLRLYSVIVSINVQKWNEKLIYVLLGRSRKDQKVIINIDVCAICEQKGDMIDCDKCSKSSNAIHFSFITYSLEKLIILLFIFHQSILQEMRLTTIVSTYSR